MEYYVLSWWIGGWKFPSLVRTGQIYSVVSPIQGIGNCTYSSPDKTEIAKTEKALADLEPVQNCLLGVKGISALLGLQPYLFNLTFIIS